MLTTSSLASSHKETNVYLDDRGTKSHNYWTDGWSHHQFQGQRYKTKPIGPSLVMISLIPLFFFLLLAFSIISSAIADETTNEYRETLSTIVPEFISKGGNIVAKENSELRLDCEIKDLGEHAFMWKFNTKFLFVGNLTIQQMKGVRKDINSNGIIIEKMTEDLTGLYKCEISSNPPKMIQYNVSMHTAPVIIPNPFNKNKIIVEKNRPLKLRCNVMPSPLPTTFRWIHNSRVIPANITDFFIESTQLSDSGEIICEAENEVGKRQYTFKVVVEAPPVVSISEQVIHAQTGNVEVKCIAKAHPPSKIQWFYANNSLIHISDKYKIVTNLNEQSSTLTIHSINPKDHDIYFCQASNGLGQATVYFEITGKPSKPKFTSPQISRNGETYLLEWVSFSQTPILSTELRIREINHENGQPGEWHSIQIEPIESKDPHHKQTYRLENLAQDKSYEVDVEVANDFGKTKSDVFVFSTSDYNNNASNMLSFNSIIILLLISVAASSARLF